MKIKHLIGQYFNFFFKEKKKKKAYVFYTSVSYFNSLSSFFQKKPCKVVTIIYIYFFVVRTLTQLATKTINYTIILIKIIVNE